MVEVVEMSDGGLRVLIFKILNLHFETGGLADAHMRTGTHS
jgi:hypothetical protein